MIITELFIPGRPVTKGSLTKVGDRLVDTPQSKAWRRVMAGAIRDDLRRRHLFGPDAFDNRQVYAGPVSVVAVWWLPVPVLQHGAGDLDKLLRNHLDALSAPGERTTDRSLCAGAIVDDNQVQHVESWKFFDAERPGVLVWVASIDAFDATRMEDMALARRDVLTA